MSTPAKSLFAFLVVGLLFSVVLGYIGIARLHRAHYPPFQESGNMFHTMDSIPHPSLETIQFLDTRAGRLLVWAFALVIPAGCIFLAFVKNFKGLGFTLLGLATLVYGLGGLSLFIHALLDAPVL